MPRIALLLPMLALCSACSDPAPPPVRGQVTLDGADIEAGVISLLPTEGKRSTCRAEIRAGRYEIANVAPGAWRVLIAVSPQATLTITRTGQQRAVVPRSQLVTPQTPGNNQVITVSADSTTFDFHLRQSRR